MLNIIDKLKKFKNQIFNNNIKENEDKNNNIELKNIENAKLEIENFKINLKIIDSGSCALYEISYILDGKKDRYTAGFDIYYNSEYTTIDFGHMYDKFIYYFAREFREKGYIATKDYLYNLLKNASYLDLTIPISYVVNNINFIIQNVGQVYITFIPLENNKKEELKNYLIFKFKDKLPILSIRNQTNNNNLLKHIKITKYKADGIQLENILPILLEKLENKEGKYNRIVLDYMTITNDEILKYLKNIKEIKYLMISYSYIENIKNLLFLIEKSKHIDVINIKSNENLNNLLVKNKESFFISNFGVKNIEILNCINSSISTMQLDKLKITNVQNLILDLSELEYKNIEIKDVKNIKFIANEYIYNRKAGVKKTLSVNYIKKSVYDLVKNLEYSDDFEIKKPYLKIEIENKTYRYICEILNIILYIWKKYNIKITIKNKTNAQSKNTDRIAETFFDFDPENENTFEYKFLNQIIYIINNEDKNEIAIKKINNMILENINEITNKKFFEAVEVIKKFENKKLKKFLSKTSNKINYI